MTNSEEKNAALFYESNFRSGARSKNIPSFRLLTLREKKEKESKKRHTGKKSSTHVLHTE